MTRAKTREFWGWGGRGEDLAEDERKEERNLRGPRRSPAGEILGFTVGVVVERHWCPTLFLFWPFSFSVLKFVSFKTFAKELQFQFKPKTNIF
jgi:hypothetical protein